MEIRGQRECRACGTRWSYYETGQITCPACGSARSVGLDEPTEHTAGHDSFDLTPIRRDVDEQPLRDLADRAADEARAYVAGVGFVHTGELQPLSETVLAASELRRVGRTVGRLMRLESDEELYFLSLLRGADSGDRPTPEEVPEVFHPERGLAVAASVDSYLSDLRRVCDEREKSVDRVLSSLSAHRKRIEALDGAVEPTEAERLVQGTRELSEYLREGDETALVTALERFDQP